MFDKIIRAIDGNIRIYLVNATKTITKGVKNHNMWPSAAKSFGRVVLMTSVLANDLLEDQKIVILINGNGRLGTIMAEGNGHGHIRGYVANPFVQTSKQQNFSDVAIAVGDKGYFRVIKDLNLKKAYESQINLIKGELIDEFNQFHKQSEQTPCGTLLSIQLNDINYVTNAVMFFVKFLPGYTKEEEKKVSNVFKTLQPFDKKVKKFNLYNLLRFAFPNAHITEIKKIKFKCSCNKEKIISLIISMIEKGEKFDNIIKTKCEYCGKNYKFKYQKIKELMNDKDW